VRRKKQKRRQYTAEFKRQALERMKVSDNIVELARELGVGRPLLYQWEAVAEGRGQRKASGRLREVQSDGEGGREQALKEEVAWLREALARKVKEADFFRCAFERVEARRRNNAKSGGTTSTNRSGR
jgi:transposase-like protein